MLVHTGAATFIVLFVRCSVSALCTWLHWFTPAQLWHGCSLVCSLQCFPRAQAFALFCTVPAGLIGGDCAFVRCSVSVQPVVQPVWGVSLPNPLTTDLSSHCPYAIVPAGLIGGGCPFVRCSVFALPSGSTCLGGQLPHPQTPDMSGHCPCGHCPYAGGMEYGSYGKEAVNQCARGSCKAHT